MPDTNWTVENLPLFTIRVRPVNGKDDDCIYSAEVFEVSHFFGEVPYYIREGAGSNSDADCTTVLDEAEKLVRGEVKWDGCSNWKFQEGYLHFCDYNALEELGKALRQACLLTWRVMRSHGQRTMDPVEEVPDAL